MAWFCASSVEKSTPRESKPIFGSCAPNLAGTIPEILLWIGENCRSEPDKRRYSVASRGFNSRYATSVSRMSFEAPAYLSGKPFSHGVAMNGHTTHILPSVKHFKNAIKAEFK